MKYLFYISLSILFFTLLGNDCVIAQNYFKASTVSADYFNHKTTHFTNGDVLIGDSSLESLRTGATEGKIFLTRLDNCGNTIWSYAYHLDIGHLDFKDFKINDSGDVFVYGSFFRGLEELIFLLKINGENGTGMDFKIWDTGSIDHFSYSMDLNNGLIMVYGLIFRANALKEGFVAIFNENLGFQWAKRFAPFESTGEAIISSDGGYMGRSGPFLIKLDLTGELDWASALNTPIISGPVEIQNGFIFESQINGLHFFYKIDELGQLVWMTDQFPATANGAAISLLTNGNILCSYSCPNETTTTNELCQLTLSPNGDIINQRQLVHENTLRIGAIYQSISNNNTISIAGNASLFSSPEASIEDFILQFSLDTLPEGCFFWEAFEDKMPNTIDLELTPYRFLPVSFDMVLVESIKADTLAFPSFFREICGEVIDVNQLRTDTFLSCGEDWLITLPNEDFFWVDGTEENPRLVNLPGIYRAKQLSCVAPIDLVYTLEKSNCGCSVYLPNVFSPNNDGINDYLEFFAGCAIEKIELSVFSRWGERLFQSNEMDNLWDGNYRQKRMPTGVYFVKIAFEWTDFDGITQVGTLFQDVTLL